MRRIEDWLKMAKAALKQAKDSLKDENYWASCFFSHQAAEFSLKALLSSFGKERRGHSLYDLLEELKCSELSIPKEFFNLARDLDRHYLQTRYVNAYPSGAPVDYYNLEDAKKSIKEAEEIIAFTEKSL